jgi:hypothetical protein
VDKKDTPLGRKASTRSNKSTRQPEKPLGQQTIVAVGPRPESPHVAKIFEVQAPTPLTPEPTGNRPSSSSAVPVHVKALVLPGTGRDGSPASTASATVSEGGGAGERYQPYHREVLEAAEKKGGRSRSGSRSPAQGSGNGSRNGNGSKFTEGA